MSEKLVKHIMHNGVISCKSDTPVADVVRILSDTDIHALVVTGENGEVAGIISHMDIITHHQEDLTKLNAAQIMTAGVISVAPDSTRARCDRRDGQETHPSSGGDPA